MAVRGRIPEKEKEEYCRKKQEIESNKKKIKRNNCAQSSHHILDMNGQERRK